MTKIALVITDEELKKAFKGTNFGGADHRQLLNASVMKKAMGYRCGHTITCIMRDIKLIGKGGAPIKRGRHLLREAYAELCLRGG